jgi:hypothetical protein
VYAATARRAHARIVDVAQVDDEQATQRTPPRDLGDDARRSHDVGRLERLRETGAPTSHAGGNDRGVQPGGARATGDVVDAGRAQRLVGAHARVPGRHARESATYCAAEYVGGSSHVAARAPLVAEPRQKRQRRGHVGAEAVDHHQQHHAGARSPSPQGTG